MERRSYAKKLRVNNREIHDVVIDPHYEEKHGDIDDDLILELVELLNSNRFTPDGRNGDWEFYTLDRIQHRGKLYKLIWCLKDDALFIGVINCYRRD
jgi:hypothetical protein